MVHGYNANSVASWNCTTLSQSMREFKVGLFRREIWQEEAAAAYPEWPRIV